MKKNIKIIMFLQKIQFEKKNQYLVEKLEKKLTMMNIIYILLQLINQI